MPTATDPHRALWSRNSGLVWLVLLAAALRFATLGRWSLWIDEAFTLHDAHDYVPSYPFGYVMTRWAVALFGDSEFALRLLPCLFGVATIAVLGLPGANEQETARWRLAALLLALSPWHLFWSQSARYYAPLTFFMVVAARAIPTRRVTDSDRRLRRWGLAVAAGGLALICHPSAAFFLPGALVYSWSLIDRRARLYGLGFVLAGGAFALYRYGYLVPIHLQYKGQGSPLQFVTSFGFLAGPLMLSVAAFGLIRTLVTRDALSRDERARMEICFGVLSGLIFLAVSFWLFVTGYHAIAALPFLMLLAARGALSTQRWPRRILVAALILEQLMGLGLYHRSSGMRPRYREAVQVMAEWPEAVVYATRDEPVAYYRGTGRRVLRDSPDARPFERDSLDEFIGIVESGRPAWLLIHPDDLHGWPKSEQARLMVLTEGHLRASLPNHLGPKELSLRVYAFHH
ncbi:glycosyltransferase family 39 protein [Saltatorellus ferox]|uniref:glycosyltransferase family 39 protein n=1 Tax=Saltatorellus ferox TaxID=2528018 RepID=UPI003AF3B751